MNGMGYLSSVFEPDASSNRPQSRCMDGFGRKKGRERLVSVVRAHATAEAPAGLFAKAPWLCFGLDASCGESYDCRGLIAFSTSAAPFPRSQPRRAASCPLMKPNTVPDTLKGLRGGTSVCVSR